MRTLDWGSVAAPAREDGEQPAGAERESDGPARSWMAADADVVPGDPLRLDGPGDAVVFVSSGTVVVRIGADERSLGSIGAVFVPGGACSIATATSNTPARILIVREHVTR